MPTIRPTTTTFAWCVAESEPRETSLPGARASRPPAGRRLAFPETERSAFGLAALDRAYRNCRRGKRQARNTQAYEARLLDKLVETRDALASGSWRPSRTLAFVTTQPKLREIHAADFADRVVHHLLVAQWEPLYEPIFIHDSYANRRGKGSHAAVDRLQSFMRRVTRSGQAPAWSLQLDIANFFNRIDRRRLFVLLRRRLIQAVEKGYDRPLARALLTHSRSLLQADPTAAVQRQGPARLWERVPPHKRLAAQGPGIGLPIGNLTSQFFANVYLNELDQFVKHRLRARYYVRYVDDFVLLHEDRATLEQWRAAIADFLRATLGLELRDLPAPRRVSEGVDFLGYVTRPFYRLVRRRVVNRCQSLLDDFAERHIRPHAWRLPPAARDLLRAQLASYLGHFRHANAWPLWQRLLARHPWLRNLFDGLDRALAGPPPRPAWAPPETASLTGQWRHFARRYPRRLVLVQVGNGWWLKESQARWLERRGLALGESGRLTRPGFREVAVGRTRKSPTAMDLGGAMSDTKTVSDLRVRSKLLRRRLKAARIPHLVVAETGYLNSGRKRRESVLSWTAPVRAPRVQSAGETSQ